MPTEAPWALLLCSFWSPWGHGEWALHLKSALLEWVPRLFILSLAPGPCFWFPFARPPWWTQTIPFCPLLLSFGLQFCVELCKTFVCHKKKNQSIEPRIGPCESCLSQPHRPGSLMISPDCRPPGWTLLKVTNQSSWGSPTISILCPESMLSGFPLTGESRLMGLCSEVANCHFGGSRHEIYKCSISINQYQLSWESSKPEPSLLPEKIVCFSCVLLSQS